jgi:hypothetical protein
MIGRQVDINSERSVLITQYHLKCKTDVQVIISQAKGHPTFEQQNEIHAIRSLNQDGYSLWKTAIKVSEDYDKLPSTEHAPETGINAIWRKGLVNCQQNGPRYIGPNCRCDCDISIAYPGQCGHDITNNDGYFIKERWSQRYYQQEHLETSSVTSLQFGAERKQVSKPLLQAEEQDDVVDVDGEHDVVVFDGDGGQTFDQAGDGGRKCDEEQERIVPIEKGKIKFAFVMETAKKVATNIFAHPKKELLMGMMLKLNELALKGSVTDKSLQETVATYSSSFTHSRGGTQMFVDSLQPGSVQLGSNNGRPKSKRMKGSHEVIMGKGKQSHASKSQKSQPQGLMSSQSSANRSCSFCKISGHNYTKCAAIASYQASAYRKKTYHVERMMNYLGNDTKYRVEVLSNELSQQFRDDPSWNCKILPQKTRHIMLCNLYHDFRKANGSEADNIVAVQFFADGAVLLGDQVYYSEVKLVRKWLDKCQGIILTKLNEIE